MDFSTKLNQLTSLVESAVETLLPQVSGFPIGPARIHEAMRYSLQAGGKRLRPALVLAVAEQFGSSVEKALPAAVAVECIHTYSLIHDDLPCMDNDDLRRGRPTAHKAFDEATALLAGDALLTQAFVILSKKYSENPVLSHALTLELSDAAGSLRLIGGQMQDLLCEKKSDAGPDDLNFIHLNKTAAMIEAPLVMGGLIGGASRESLRDLRLFGRHLGLAFQIVDDILDTTSDSATLGKTVGKDAASGKTTYVSLHGLEQARAFAEEQTQAAIGALAKLPGDSTFLRHLADYLTNRKS